VEQIVHRLLETCARTPQLGRLDPHELLGFVVLRFDYTKPLSGRTTTRTGR